MKKHLLVSAIFVILIIAITFPLILNLNTCIPAFFSTDEPQGVLWNSWRIQHSFQNKIPLRHTSLTSYPYGVSLYSSGYVPYSGVGLFYFLSFFTSPALTWNIQILLNLFFTAFFLYLLIFFLTKNQLASVFSGIVFSFSPQHFARIWQHWGLTYWQWIPLILLASALLKEKISRKRAILFFLSIIFLFSFDFSIMYFGGMSLGLFLIYVLLYNWKSKFFKNSRALKRDAKYIKKVFILGLLALILLFPQFYPIIRNYFSPPLDIGASGYNPYLRPLEDLFTQSAKPLSYFLPSTEHPIFGGFTQNFIGSFLWGTSVTEHQLYLGWVGIILSFIAFRYWRKKRKEKDQTFLQSDENFYIGFFIFLALAAWLMSQPPWWNILGFKVYLPSFFLYKILPMYRAYGRFGIIVMLSVACLAGFGLKILLERQKSRRRRMVLGVFICILALFEFWNWPPFKVLDVSKAPEVYSWIKDQPGDFAIAEYPLDADGPHEMYRFYQIFHHKPIINATLPGTYANRIAKTMLKLSQYEVAQELKWMGVKYVFVHKNQYLTTDLQEDADELKKIPKNKGLKFVRSFSPEACPDDTLCSWKSGPIDVYEVIASPLKPTEERIK
ncbi:MAG: hypothetical protein P9M07_01710 [Candidatus Aceula meridiana]|nr:hypothetical protein [Candidatus Aceula meridiana]